MINEKITLHVYFSLHFYGVGSDRSIVSEGVYVISDMGKTKIMNSNFRSLKDT